ncbi:putative RNA recognition motif (a k a RRM RBD or RNP domain) [Trypanosoma vivax]|nr:putative RNA recognition motif (a k a RRM RBD or RNP domain) [Trypanosoma vivax]
MERVENWELFHGQTEGDNVVDQAPNGSSFATISYNNPNNENASAAAASQRDICAVNEGRDEPPGTVTYAEDTCVLRLHGLPYAVKEEQIRHFFSDFALAEENPILFFADGLHRGTGFVRLLNSSDVPLAISKLHRQHIDANRYVEVSSSSEKEREQMIKEQEESSKAHVVRLRGLPFSANEGDVKKFIESENGVISINICCDSEGLSTGDAFIELKEESDVERIKQLHHKTMGKRYIEVLSSTVYDRDAIMRAAKLRSRRDKRNARADNSAVASNTHQQYQPQPGVSSMIAQGFVDPFFNTCLNYLPPLPFGQKGPHMHHHHHHHHHYHHYHHQQQQKQHQNLDRMQAHDLSHSSTHARASYYNHMEQADVMGTASSASAYPPGYGGPPLFPIMASQPSFVAQRPPSAHVVRVRGLPYSATEETVAEFFSGVKIPPQGVHMVYNEQDRFTGEAFVEVEDENDVSLAKTKHGKTIGNRYIEVFGSSPAAMQRLGNPVVRMMPYHMQQFGVASSMFC